MTTIDMAAVRAKRRHREIKIGERTWAVRPVSLGLLETLEGQDENSLALLKRLIDALFGEGAWDDFRTLETDELKTIVKALIPGSLPDFQPDDDGLLELFEGLTGKKNPVRGEAAGPPPGTGAGGPGNGGHGDGP